MASRVHSRWQRRVRGRGAQVARRELGDSYDAFLADLSREKFALLRPPIASSAVPGPQDLTR
ncbi:hypothetical protein ACIHCQ_19930 [Streptomyces sp. NPDC052236]|uniref:hypothetical protein n=1 Tax=Streptomyces sp. NPDC052236 TaxID=3365686 RepID=UPI0037D74F46